MASYRASIIVCVHNRSHQIQPCLESLTRLDFADYEIVIVDDASTDDTPAVLESFRRANPTRAIAIVRNQQNRGVSGARNAGVGRAQGEFVAFTDSDCIVEPGWLRNLVESLEPSGWDAASGPVQNLRPTNLAERACLGTDHVGKHPLQRRGLIGCNMIVRGEIIRRYRFDESLIYGCDEDDLAWRMKEDGYRIGFVSTALVHHHHPHTLRSYLRQGLRQGAGSARYWYKRGIYVGRDMLPLASALASLPLVIFDLRFLWITAVLLFLQLGALLFNEVGLKGKSVIESIRVMPVCILYTAVKAWSVLHTLARIFLGCEPAIRESKRSWHCSRRRARQQTLADRPR